MKTRAGGVAMVALALALAPAVGSRADSAATAPAAADPCAAAAATVLGTTGSRVDAIRDLRRHACAIPPDVAEAMALATADTSADLHEEWALLLFVNDEREAAHAQLARALDVRLRVDGPTSAAVARTLRRAGWLLALDGRPQEAMPLIDRALAIVGRTPEGASSAEADDLRLRKAMLLLDLSRAEESLELLEQVVAWREKNAPRTAPCALRTLATLYRQAGETGKAHLLEERAAGVGR